MSDDPDKKDWVLEVKDPVLFKRCLIALAIVIAFGIGYKLGGNSVLYYMNQKIVELRADCLLWQV